MKAQQILVVEDEAIVAKNIELALKKKGYGVPAMAASGEDAIQKAAELRPNLVLMDIRLQGDMLGVEAAEQIHARYDIPVVYLTSYADESTLQRAMQSKPFGYLVKPFRAEELHTTIAMALYSLSLPHTPPKGAEAGGDVLGLSALKLLARPSFLVFALCAFLISIPLSFYFVWIVPFLTESKAPGDPTTLTSISQYSEIVVMFLLPWFIPRIGLKKVLVIGIDGVRPDVLAEVDTPNIDALIADGTFTDDVQSKAQTISGPGWSSMVIGAWPDKHLVTDNDFTGNNYAKYPDFLTRLEWVAPEISTFAVVDWPPLGPPSPAARCSAIRSMQS